MAWIVALREARAGADAQGLDAGCRSGPAPPALTVMGCVATGATIALEFRMAMLIRLPKCKLTMYAGDHNPPHCHVLANDGSEALIDLASLQVIDGTVRPAVLKEALAWASQNLAVLTTKWKELNP